MTTKITIKNEQSEGYPKVANVQIYVANGEDTRLDNTFDLKPTESREMYIHQHMYLIVQEMDVEHG